MVSKIYEESIAKDNPHIKKDQDDKGRPMGSVDWVTVRVRGEERCMAKLPRSVTRALLIHPEAQNIVRSLVYEGKFNEAMSLSQDSTSQASSGGFCSSEPCCLNDSIICIPNPSSTLFLSSIR